MDSLQHDENIYYPLEQLSLYKRRIQSTVEQMQLSRSGIDKHIASDKLKAKDAYDVLCKSHERLIENITGSVLCLHEIGEDETASYGSVLSENVKNFNLMTKDYGALERALEVFTEQLPEQKTTNASVIGRCMNSVRMGHYPTDLENVEHIMNAITFPDGIVSNLLDPCCGDGTALKKLAMGNNCFTYGVELDEFRAEAAQEELHRVAFGSFFHSRMSHDAFHVVFLNPPYLAVLNESGRRSRDEKRFLVESISHLMIGGLLIYIIPYYRLTPDICRVLADNFEDISVHRFTDKEFSKFSQVAVMGRRVKRIDGSEIADSIAELAYTPEELPCITDIEPGRYHIPAQSKKVELFKGAVFNIAELQRQLKTSKSLDSVIACKKSDEEVRRPPLPFSFSQLGLIGGSGLINGLIDCDSPHIIKGRIVKETNAFRDENRNANGELMCTEITETVSNKMIFNILTPQGFKSLT